MRADAARRQIHQLLQDRGELLLVRRSGGIDIERQRLGDADRIGDLDRAALGEPGGDDVLGEIARRVGGGAVDLGRVLAGKRAAAMRRRAAIGVDDDLAAGDPGIAVGAADHKAAGRVDEKIAPRRTSSPRAGVETTYGRTISRTSSCLDPVGMLDRDDDLGRPHRLAVDILQGHLAFRVGAQQRRLSGMPRLGQRAQDGMRVKDRRRHQFRRLVAGIAEHHALVAGALVLVARGVDALRDIATTGRG